MDLSAINLEYLRPPSSAVESIQHPLSYIKEGQDYQAIRRIFYNVSFDSFEKKQLRTFQDKLSERGIILPQEWTENEILKHLYASKFVYEKTIKDLNIWEDWRGDKISRTVTPGVRALYESGILYTYGKDRQLRPIIILDCGKINLNNTRTEELNAAITILLDVLAKFCYYPGKIENCTVIIDTRKFSMLQLPLSALESWITIGNACFPCNMFKTYIIGPPSILIHVNSWFSIQSLMEKETVQKIEFVEPHELIKLQSSINSSQLEDKFGGSLPRLATFWPPQLAETKPYDRPRWSLQSLQEINDMIGQSTPSLRMNPSNPHVATFAGILGSKGHFDPNETGSFFYGSKGSKDLNERHTVVVAGKIDPITIHDIGNSYSRSPVSNKSPTGKAYGPPRVEAKDEILIKNLIYSNKIEMSPTKTKSHALYRITPQTEESFSSRNRELSVEYVKKGAPTIEALIFKNVGDKSEEEKILEDNLNKELHNLSPGHYVKSPGRRAKVDLDKRVDFNETQGLIDMIINEDCALKENSKVGSVQGAPRDTKGKPNEMKQKQSPEPNGSQSRIWSSYQSSPDQSMLSQTKILQNENSMRYSSKGQVVEINKSPSRKQAVPMGTIQEENKSRSPGEKDYADNHDDNERVSEWNYKKSKRASIDDNGEEKAMGDEETNFCGICLVSR